MRLIDADKLFEEIDQAQESLITNDDKMWNLNKPYFKGLAWARGLINESPTINPYEWISVEDDKPKKNGYYLCWRMTSKCGGKEYWQIDKLYWEDNLWLMHHNTFTVADYVTYWMTLPEPPTEKEN